MLLAELTRQAGRADGRDRTGDLSLTRRLLCQLSYVGNEDRIVARQGSVEDVEAADQAGRELFVSASAYSEALVAFVRANRVDDARNALTMMGIRVAPMTMEMAEQAAKLRARHQRLRLPDAIALAIAQEMGGELQSYDDRLSRLARKRK